MHIYVHTYVIIDYIIECYEFEIVLKKLPVMKVKKIKKLKSREKTSLKALRSVKLLVLHSSNTANIIDCFYPQ